MHRFVFVLCVLSLFLLVCAICPVQCSGGQNTKGQLQLKSSLLPEILFSNTQDRPTTYSLEYTLPKSRLSLMASYSSSNAETSPFDSFYETRIRTDLSLMCRVFGAAKPGKRLACALKLGIGRARLKRSWSGYYYGPIEYTSTENTPVYIAEFDILPPNSRLSLANTCKYYGYQGSTLSMELAYSFAL